MLLRFNGCNFPVMYRIHYLSEDINFWILESFHPNIANSFVPAIFYILPRNKCGPHLSSKKLFHTCRPKQKGAPIQNPRNNGLWNTNPSWYIYSTSSNKFYSEGSKKIHKTIRKSSVSITRPAFHWKRQQSSVTAHHISLQVLLLPLNLLFLFCFMPEFIVWGKEGQVNWS